MCLIMIYKVYFSVSGASSCLLVPLIQPFHDALAQLGTGIILDGPEMFRNIKTLSRVAVYFTRTTQTDGQHVVAHKKCKYMIIIIKLLLKKYKTKSWSC